MGFKSILKVKYIFIIFLIGRFIELALMAYSGYLFKLPNNYNPFEITDFQASYFFDRIMLIAFIIGLVQAFKNKSFQLNRAYLFSIQLWFIGFIMTHVVNRIFVLDHSSAFQFDSLVNSLYSSYYILEHFTLVYFMFYFQSQHKSRGINIQERKVSKGGRVINLLLDTVFFYLIFGIILHQISYFGFTYPEVEWMNSDPYIVIFVLRFFYYFISESVFLQTPGKVHNNAKVYFRRNRIGSIALRTLCRFIPFNAFSFFGENGWHDSLSKTKVLLPLQEAESTDKLAE